MDDEDGGTIADQVTRFVSRFVDRVGTEAGISQEHLKSLYTMIPGQFDHHRSLLKTILLSSGGTLGYMSDSYHISIVAWIVSSLESFVWGFLCELAWN